MGYTAHKKQGPDSETTRPFSTVQMFDVNLGFSFWFWFERILPRLSV